MPCCDSTDSLKDLSYVEGWPLEIMPWCDSMDSLKDILATRDAMMEIMLCDITEY